MRSNAHLRTILRDSSKGQATLEYVLLLFVIVAMAGGALYQFSTAFQKFSAAYFGDYLTCLIETGELPQLGGSSPESICDNRFKAFSLADGKPLNNGSAGGSVNGNGGNSSSNSNGSSDSKSSSSDSGSKNSGSSSNSNSSQSKTGSKSSGGSDSGSGGIGESSVAGGKSGVPAGKKDPWGGGDSNISGRSRYVPLASSGRSGGSALKGDDGAGGNGSGGKAGGPNSGESELGRLRYIPSGRGDSGPDLRANAVPAGERDAKGRGGRFVAADGEKKKSGSNSEADVGLTLPNFLKIIFIIALILMIIVFVGGQVLAISKSQDK